jgi:hypothetical protein
VDSEIQAPKIGRDRKARPSQWVTQVENACPKLTTATVPRLLASGDNWRDREEQRVRLAAVITAEPKPCARFSKRIPLNEKFLAHLPNCAACKAVILHLERRSQLDLFRHKHRN